MAVKSKTLFHFTPKAEYLFDILENGFWPRYCEEDIEWFFNSDIKEILASSEDKPKNIIPEMIKYMVRKNIYTVSYPMVCFCDIPLSQITNHTDFYGKYGIGLTKEWGINQHLNPIWYISDKSGFSDTLWKNLFQGGFLTLLNLLCGSEKIDLNTLPFLRFIKPLKGKMKKNGQLVRKDFDEECEWRYSPVSTDQSFMSILPVLATQNQEKLKNDNQILKQKASLKFEPSDIKYIFVPEDKDIPDLISKIHEIFRKRGYEESEIYLLSSKVISLQTIREDF